MTSTKPKVTGKPEKIRDSNKPIRSDEEDFALHAMHQWEEERPDLDFSHQSIVLRLIRLGLYARRENGIIFQRELKVRGEDVRVLFALRRAGAPFRLRPTDLFKSLLIPSATMTRQLDRLVKAKLVSRILDPNDKRSALVELTPRGLKLSDAAMETIRKHSRVSTAVQHLGRKDKEQLEGLLSRLIASVEKDGPLE